MASTEAEFDAFFRATCPALVGLGYVLTGQRALAQDLAQETMTRAWQRWEAVRTYDNPPAWCRRVLCNLATREWRRAKRRSTLAFAEPVADEPDLEAVALARALRVLPVTQRQAIVLHDGAGVPVAEIAAQFEVPEGTVRSWLSRGRRVLAVELEISDDAKKAIQHG